MNVCEYLLEGKPPSAPALLTQTHQYSYGQLRAASAFVADSLARSGAHRGERAILLGENSFFWAAAYLGILRAGLVAVPLPPKSSVEDLQYICGTTKPVAAFVDSRARGGFKAPPGCARLMTDRAPADVGWDVFDYTSAQEEPHAPGIVMDPNELAALMFTSGSTGRPRGVMVSHGNILANTTSIIASLALTAQDRMMTVLPFHYCFGTSLLHTHLRVGGSLVLNSQFMYPEAVLQHMRASACTGFAGVPSHFQILLRRSTLASTEFPDLRYVQQAGGQLAPSFISELQAALPGKAIFIMYGQTEATARLSCLPSQLLTAKRGSVGKGIPGVRLRVIDEAGHEVAPGETGEIVACGANVALRYWNDPEETRRCFRHGRLYTGDIATVDEDGYIYILDRLKDFLKCGGQRVSCRYIENKLLEHQELVEAAVVGEADPVFGEAAIAYVVPRDRRKPPSADELLTHCRSCLPPIFIPKRFELLSTLPKNGSGKVLKAALRAMSVSVAANDARVAEIA